MSTVSEIVWMISDHVINGMKAVRVPFRLLCDAFYESTDYESFMRNIYSLPCDSDTFGAIAGGVAEEFYHGFGDIDAEGILKKHLTDDLYDILMR